jgi:D-alanyl-D-alanine carboxypeptidase
MNQKVRDLGLTNTNFVNPTGLDEPMHYSTARDLVRVSVEAMKNPVFAEIVGTKEKVVTSSDGKIVHKLKNINELLGEVDGVLGIKTGWTEGARENLVTYVDRNGQKILIALLGSQDRFGETKEMIDWLYGSYEWNDVVYDGQ